MHIALDYGHNCPPDTGAVGLKIEDVLTKELGAKLTALLIKEGVEITICTPEKAQTVGHSLRQRCYAANISRADYFVSLHFNAFNGKAHGSEIFAVSPKGRALAAAILDRLCDLGFKDRGVKNGSHLYVVKNTSMPAVLVEGCFIDSKKDMELLDLDKMAQAIAEGILEFYTPKTATITEEDNYPDW